MTDIAKLYTVLDDPVAMTDVSGHGETVVDRLTFGGNIIQTGTDSYRLARTRTQLIEQPAGKG